MISPAIIGVVASSGVVSGGGGGAAGVYTASQSSVYGGTTAGSYASLTDLNGTTGAATNNTPSERIIATFPSPVLVTAVTVGGGQLPNWGSVAPYLNNRFLQYSTDGITWTDVLVFAGVTDSGVDQFKEFVLGTPIMAQRWCVGKSGWTATTELRFR